MPYSYELNSAFRLIGLEFDSPVNTVKVMMSQSVYLTTLFWAIFSVVNQFFH